MVELRRALGRVATVHVIDECFTSQRCAAEDSDGRYCDGLLEGASVVDEHGNDVTPWSVKACKKCGTVSFLDISQSPLTDL